MEIPTNMPVSMEEAVVIPKQNLAYLFERYGFVYGLPLTAALISWFLVSIVGSVFCMSAENIVGYVKNYTEYWHWAFTRVGLFIGLSGKEKIYDCYRIINDFPAKYKCGAVDYVQVGWNGGFGHIGNAVIFGFVVAIGVFILGMLWCKRKNRESLHAMKHFKRLRGAVMLSPAEVMTNVDKARRGEPWKLE